MCPTVVRRNLTRSTRQSRFESGWNNVAVDAFDDNDDVGAVV